MISALRHSGLEKHYLLLLHAANRVRPVVIAQIQGFGIGFLSKTWLSYQEFGMYSKIPRY